MRFLCAILTGATVIGLGLRAEAALVTGISAIAHDSVVTFQEVEDRTALFAEHLRQQYASTPAVLEKKIAEAYKENLDVLLENQLILHDFQTAGYNLPESIIDEQLQEYIKSKYNDRVTLTKTLQQQGITFEKFRQDYKEHFIVEQMRYKNVSGEIIISPHKVET